MEGTNSFEKGLHRSNSPQMQPEGSYVDAYNWIRNDSGRLTNEELESITKTLEDAASYTYLGSCPVQDSFIIFFQQLGNDGNKYSEIGLFQNGSYTRVFNDFFTNPSYRLNFTKDIDSVARINNKGEIVVYFVEEGQFPRRFNITEFQNTGEYSSTSYNTLNDWNLQLNLKLPHAVLDIENNGGSVLSGTYSVVFRYRTDINNKSTFGIPSRMIYITDDIGQTTSTDGCPPGTQTTKSIKITPTNIDSNYPYIEPVIITYVGTTNVLTIKSLGLYPNDGTAIYFRDESQYKDSVALEEITENPVYYDSAKCIEQKDNILVLSNLTGKKYDRDFQKVASDIKVTFYYDNTYTIGGSVYPSDWFELNGSVDLYDSDTGYKRRGFAVGMYDDGNSTTNAFLKPTDASFPFKNGLDKKGFTRGEIYSLSITPIYKDGSIGFAYHIPAVPHTTFNGFNTTDVYISEESYPDYLLDDVNFPYNRNNSNGKIRHHRMPDYTGVGEMRCLPVERGVLRLRVNNINFTPEQKAIIQGYIIGYQPRDSDANTRIVDSGWVKPYLANGTYYRNSFFNGSCYFQFRNRADMTFNPQGKGLMYYSPDTFIGKKLNKSYKVQVYGWARERLAQDSEQSLFYTTFPENADSDTAAFWDHFETEGNPSPLFDLEETIEVPAVGENFTTVLGKYRIEYSGFYYHLETTKINDQSVLDTSDWGTYYNPPTYKLSKVVNDTGDVTRWIKINMSISHIPLARIVNDIFFQYGKLENAQYIPSEVVYNIDQTSSEVEGDIFLSKYFHHNLDGFRNNFTGGGYDNNDDSSLFHYYAGIWYESKNNYAFRHYDVLNNEVPYYPKLKDLHIQSGGGKGLINYEWWKRGFGYNRQYSASNNFKNQFSRPLFFDEVTDYSNRSIYSKQSFENELVDQYRYFPALQYHDIPKHRGAITDTFVFNNNFFHHTEYGLWLSYFNPNTIQATSQGQVVLGNAGVFQLPSKLILDIKGGYMGTMDKSGTNTPFGRVFLDHKQGKVFLFAGEAPVEISDLGLFSFFRGFVNTNNKYTMGYDWANKRLLINNITQEKAISYYPKTETWTSLHNFSPNAYFTINGSSYAWRNNENSFYNMDNQDGIRKNSYITFVENTQPDAFKRFDRIEMNTMSGGNEGINSPGFVEPTSYIFNDESFSTIHCWTDRQNSTELPFAYSHDFENNFLNNYDPSKVPTNYYRSSFHAELPLDAVVDPYTNIFNPNNTNINRDFRAHMKGKFLYTKLSYNQDKPLVLNYIKTFFKPSVA